MQLLENAGFDRIRWFAEDYLPYGIQRSEQWSLPLALRKVPPAYSAGTMKELMAALAEARKRAGDSQSDYQSLKQRKWVKIGRSLGVL